MENMEHMGEIQSTVPVDTQQGNSGEIMVAPAAGETDTAGDGSVSPICAREEWEQLIRGPCKQFYTEDTQRIINERFKRFKTLEKQAADTAPVLELLMERFGVTDGSVDGLRQRLEQERAEQERERAQADALAQEQVERWGQEGARVAEIYPDFDLGRLLADETFYALVTNPDRPVSLQRAYEVTHLEDIKRAQAELARAQVVDSIRARGARPDENGTSGQSGFTVREDVSKLTGAALADIRRRVMSGERISFG